MPRFSRRSGREVLEGHPRLPDWIVQEKVKLSDLHAMKARMRESALHTVCEEARCPNRNHCFTHGTATFLLMGDTCTRACGFCSIRSGRPLPLDPREPEETAQRVASLGLKFAVLTSVNRDDLPDGGAAHFAGTIRAIRRLNPGTGVEVLTPDFMGDLDAVAEVVAAGPAVFNHNTETVPSLYAEVRPAGRFQRSLDVLAHAKRLGTALFGDEFRTKSGLMLGLGETEAELMEVFGKLVEAGVDILTLGQYLRPTRHQLPVKAYVHPDAFAELGRKAKALGFRTVYAGPLVRSSFNAHEVSAMEGISIA
ncbi:lipoyl synthase [Mesoterricola silvestris]|uniref:Lipoyl synthase n=1 Tax=Mesoterricola silvestris TaxID=2927979 RepID=A0AA48GH66_9BACT|nr:lipoyl synthase [Mesoterricola silvestris]BDU70869.1 lipoyl synthase 2 [Mesoterricola silvestris]